MNRMRMQSCIAGLLMTALMLWLNGAAAASEGFEHTVTTPHFRFHLHGRNHAIDRMIEEAEPQRARYVEQLGADFDGATEVYVVTGEAEFHRVQPPGARVPDWAIGVAWPEHNFLVLKLMAIQGGMPDLAATFRHELSHIVFGRVTNLRQLPKWFVEGVAMFQAGEWSLDRHEQMMTSSLMGRLYRLRDLEDRFPAGHASVSLAYTQSLHFVGWLHGELGPEGFRRFIRALGAGKDFYTALEQYSGLSLSSLEEKWLSNLRRTYSWLPLLTGGGFLWFALALLFIAAYLRMRRQRALALARLAEEDRWLYGDEDPTEASSPTTDAFSEETPTLWTRWGGRRLRSAARRPRRPRVRPSDPSRRDDRSAGDPAPLPWDEESDTDAPRRWLQ